MPKKLRGKEGLKSQSGKRKSPRGKCHFCKTLTDKEYRCFGCRSIVCDNCEADPLHPPMGGPHSVDDHLLTAKDKGIPEDF